MVEALKTELHPVVELLLERMKSNPDEFTEDGSYRWGRALRIIDDYGSEEEQAAVQRATRELRLQELHEQVMEELLNPKLRYEAQDVATPTTIWSNN